MSNLVSALERVVADLASRSQDWALVGGLAVSVLRTATRCALPHIPGMRYVAGLRVRSKFETHHPPTA